MANDPYTHEEFDAVIKKIVEKVNKESKMNKYVLFDMDGCLSNDRWRMKDVDFNIDDMDERYRNYCSQASHDKPMNMDHVIFACLDAYPIIVTARPVVYKESTQQWLQKYFPVTVPHHNLLMRPIGNHFNSPELKVMLVQEWLDNTNEVFIIGAFDDRQDVLDAYKKAFGISGAKLGLLDDRPPPSEREVTPDVILQRMAETYKERNLTYGNNYSMIGPMIKILFPDGVPAEVLTVDQFHLLELILVKLSRFAISGLTHTDSIHDAAVYAAMIESIILTKGRKADE